jgi:hypothetical protein
MHVVTTAPLCVCVCVCVWGGGVPVSTAPYHSPLWHLKPLQCVFWVTSRVGWQCWNCCCLFQWVGWVGRPNPCRRSRRWRPLRSPTCFDTLGAALGRRATVAVKTDASLPAQRDSPLEVSHLTMSWRVFVIPYSLIGGYWRFGGTKFLLLWRRRQWFPPKRRHQRGYIVLTHKTTSDIFACRI